MGNNNFPCASGSVAAQAAGALNSPPDSPSSGVDQADGSKVVTFDTTKMHSSTVFAVCYAETDGTHTDSWVDTGLRLTVSKIIVHYGPYSTSFPVRQWLSPNVMPAINRMPQVADAIITYVGELADAKYIAMVDASLNGNNPCVDAAVAGAAADTLHSGAVTAATGTQAATIPQATGKLLDATKTFTICYAETSGSDTDTSWRDSYVRVRISKIHTFSAHSVAHKTNGSLAKTPALEITYAGSLAASMWVSMVDATLNSNFPCASGTVAAAPAEAAVYSPPNGTSSGVDQADGSKVVTFDTTKMHSSIVFAVCYAETDGTHTDSWVDTGLRLTVSKIIFHYGPYSTSFPVRQWPSSNVMPATNRMPQVADAIITYVGELADAKYIAMIDASLNGNNPCVNAAVAGAAADT